MGPGEVSHAITIRSMIATSMRPDPREEVAVLVGAAAMEEAAEGPGELPSRSLFPAPRVAHLHRNCCTTGYRGDRAAGAVTADTEGWAESAAAADSAEEKILEAGFPFRPEREVTEATEVQAAAAAVEAGVLRMESPVSA